MSLSARLYIGDNASSYYMKEYPITQLKTDVSRRYNTYRPDSDPKYKVITLSVVAPGKDDMTLHEWYIDQTRLSGKIVIDLTNLTARYNTTERCFKFEEAICFSIAETYDIGATSRHQIKLKIMARQMEIDDMEFQYDETDK